MPKTSNPLLRRRSTAPPAKPPARKSSASTAPVERLDDVGALPSLAPPCVPQDVQSLLRHIAGTAFDAIPERAAGMGSERVSEVLRFHARLPRIVSVAHLTALSVSPTGIERELAGLVARGLVRKVVIPGRGKGGAAVGEGVVLMEDWKARVADEPALDEDVKAEYLALLDANPASQTAQTPSLSKDDVRALVQAGFLTSPAALSTSLTTLFSRPTSTSSPTSVSRAGHNAPTGSLAATGGASAIHDSGGSGSMLATSATRTPVTTAMPGQSMTFSLPATGAYLKLLTSARAHLLALLRQLSPRHREATWDALREKWDGGVATPGAERALKRGAGVLPGKTRRWREFYGLRFEWIVAEAVGSGVVEVFDTGVGVWGVRAI